MVIPVEHIDLAKVKRQLTYRYQPMGEPKPVRVAGYVQDGDYLRVPRQFGLRICNQLQIPWEDNTAEGTPVKWPKAVSPRDYQKEPLARLLSAFDDYFDVTFRAHTGWGKTIGSLITASRLGTTTLIVVDQDNLKQQWIETLTEVFGFKADQVGLIQGQTCEYQGKPVAIAMVQTLTQKTFPKRFYDYWGMLIGDETHTIGAPTFSSILLQFPAMYRLFVSATPKRRDGLQKALDYNCGPVRVAADKEHAESSVYLLRNPRVYSWYGNVSPKVGRIISEVSEDPVRNMMIAEAALWLWETGRDTIIMSDRIEHLKNLQCLLTYLGVPEEEIGLYAGYDPKWVFGKDPKPKRRPPDLHRWVDREGEEFFAEYSAVSMQLKDKKVPKPRLEHVKTKCSIILATFGKFSKGVDEPRLAAGIDATPRSTAEQIQGRILRELAGKLKPIWATVVDDNNYRLLHSFSGRVGEYLKSNSRLFDWDGQEGISEWNVNELLAGVRERVDELKRMQIVKGPNGGYELAPPAALKRQEMQEMKDRIKKARRQPRRTSTSGGGSAK